MSSALEVAKAIGIAIKTYGDMSGLALVNKTLLEWPWLKTSRMRRLPAHLVWRQSA